LADAIDTLEKYAPVYNDQDGALSFQIGRGFKHLELDMDDVYELVSLSAIPEPEEHLVPNSSMRYLLAIDQRTSHCAFRTHLNFIENKPVAALPVSFKRILSTQFYTYIKRRLVNVRNLEKFALPNVSEMKLDVPITQLMNKEFSVILKDAPLADVVKKFKETKHEIIVVVDKSGKVVGTMNPVDLLHILDTMGSSHLREHHA
jgi:CBS domain-containing protein